MNDISDYYHKNNGTIDLSNVLVSYGIILQEMWILNNTLMMHARFINLDASDKIKPLKLVF